MKKLIVLLSMLAMSCMVGAQKRYEVNVEGGGGVSFLDNGVVHEYGFYVVAGHKMTDSFSILGGIGEVTTLRYNTPSIPVFIRTSWTIPMKKVLPIIGFDLGYSFLPRVPHVTIQDLKINVESLDYKWYEMGYHTVKEYNTRMLDTKDKNFFANGSRSYLSEDRASYGREGIFALLNISVRVLIPSIEHSVLVSASAGFSQYYYGHFIKTLDNKILRYGRTDNLAGEQGALIAKEYTWGNGNASITEPYYEQTRGERVLTEGNEEFLDRFKPVLSVRAAFEF